MPPAKIKDKQLRVKGTMRIPTTVLHITTCKSCWGEGTNTWDRFEFRIHKRVIDLISSPDVVKQITSITIELGVEVKIKILVDNAGEAYEQVDHSPWNRCTLVDFVMPFFLSIASVGIAFALKRVPNIGAAVKKIVIRTLKLLFWGLLQGENIEIHILNLGNGLFDSSQV